MQSRHEKEKPAAGNCGLFKTGDITRARICLLVVYHLDINGATSSTNVLGGGHGYRLSN